MKSHLGAACAAVLFNVVASYAYPQAALLSSIPVAGANVRSGYFEFHLRFNSFVDRERSRIYLTHPNGSQEYLVLFEAGSPTELMAATQLSPGDYVLHWQALQSNGDAATGVLRFRVGAQ